MEYDDRTGRKKKNKDGPPAANETGFKEHMRVYFPSHNTVRTSRGGMNVSYRKPPDQRPLYPASSLQSEWCFPDYSLVSRYDLLSATLVGFQIIPSRGPPGFKEREKWFTCSQQAVLCPEARLWSRGFMPWVGVSRESQPI